MAVASAWLIGWLSMLLFGPVLMIIELALLVAWVALIYFWVQPGDAGDNAYGPPPPVFDPSVRASPTPRA